MTDIIIPTGDMPVTAKVTTVGKGIIAAQVSAAGAELAQDAAKAATEATEATKEATDNANNATAAAKTATSDAKKATTAANSAADAAKTATTNANNATSAAKTATTNANTATDAAKTATDAAKTATTAANKAADRANTAAGNVENIVSGAVATPQKTGVVYIADKDGTTEGTLYNTACSMAFYHTAASAMGELMDAAQGTADDAWSRTLRVQISSSPADATGDTSALTATVWRGGQQLTEQEVAMMGLVAWYVGGSRVATGGTYTCAAGTAAECRLEA